MNDLVSKFLSTPATQSWAKSLKDKSGARVGTMLALDPRTPDETAEAMRVGEGLGLPANVVASDVSGFKRQLDQKKNTTALSGAPKTAKWLEDLNNGILAKDDIDNLSWFEKNVEQSPGALTRGVGRGIVRTGAIVPELGARIDAQLVQDVGRTAEAIYQDELKRLGPNALPEMRATARQTAQARFEAVQGMGAEDRAAILQRGAASLSDAREVLDRAAAIPMNETATKFRDETLANAENTLLGTIKAFASDPVGGMSFIAQTAAEVLPILAASTATTAITRSPAAGVGTMSGGSFLTENANSAMEFLAEKGVDLSTPEAAALVLDDAELMREAAERGVTRGLIIAMFDAVSGGIAGQALMKSPMGDVVAQGMSQMVLGGTGEAAAQSASGQEISWQDIVTEGLAELATAPVEVGGVAGRGILRNLSKSADAGTTAAAIDEIDRMAANSKLRERAPDKFAEALDAQGDSDFYIAADDLREYFQAKDVEFDDETLEAWGIDPIDFRQAESTGGDVTVSRSAYATRIFGTEDAAWFRDNAIRTPGEMSVSQAARFNSEVRDVMERAIADAEDQRTRDLELRTSDVKVYDNVFSQLRAAGRTRDVADNEARVWSSFWRTMADRYGGDPLELAQSMGVQIVGPQTPDAARRRNDLDIKLNTLRSNPQRALRAEGTDLLDFVRSKGGISDTGGDVAAMDAPKGIISETREQAEARRGQPNMLGLSDSKGTGLDEIGRAAIEAGYFPELMGGSDVQADGTVVDEAAVLLEALQRAISGEAIYPVGEGPNQDMVDLSNELSRRGIDLAMSNDEIAAALEDQGGLKYDQSGKLITDTPEFRAWFGDSKVVDENGDPLVVYHGDNQGRDELHQGNQGFRENLSDADRARLPDPVFFSDNQEVAGSYEIRRQIKGAVDGSPVSTETYNVYLSIQNPMVIDANGGRMAPKSMMGITYSEAKALGHDGVIFRNVVDDFEMKRDPSDVYVTFSPTQIKSVYNRGTFDANDPRILFQSAAPSGSDAFRAWAGTDDVLDSDEVNDTDFSGSGPWVMRAWHGTTHELSEFDASVRGNREGQFDAVNYFSSSKSDASGNYGADGQDLTSRIEQRAERLEDEIYNDPESFGFDFDDIENSDVRMEKARELAATELKGGTEKTLRVFVRTEKPFVVGGEGSPFIEFADFSELEAQAIARVADDEGVTVEEIEDARDDYEDQIDEARWDLEAETENPLFVAVQEVADRYDMDASALLSDLSEISMEGTDHSTLEKIMRDSEGLMYAEDPETGDIIGYHVLAEIVEALGFDSIILKNADQRFSNMDIDPGTAHIHVFDSHNTNIKSVDNQGTFDRSNPNIFFQSENGPVTLDALALEGDNQAIVAKAFMDGAGAGPQNLSNIFESVSFGSEADSLAGIPSQAPMLSLMRSIAVDNGEVLDAIIQLVPVDVVNNFFGSKAAAKVALHNEAMLQDSPAFNAELSVASGFGDTTRAVRFFLSQEALPAAKAALVSLDARLKSAEAGSARVAGQVNSFSQGETSKKRASIVFDRDGLTSTPTIINLFETANLSSFLHESGHFFLEAFTALATSDTAPQGMKDDLAAIRKFLKVDGTAPLTTAQHEMWARAFEAYAMEGKAPSLALADAFGRFKSWLTRIYKTALGLNVKITPEIREVMDRMLATDAEIAAAREMQQMSPLFTSEAAAGMTPAAWETYQKMARRSEEQASQALLEKTMAKVRREKETWWKDERADVKKEVTTTVDSKPEYRLIEMLANQKWIGSDDPVPDFQLDRTELVETFGDGVLAELSRSRFGGKRAIYGADGISLYEAAEFFGFANPTEMVETLQNTSKKKDAIELETDRIMADRYGDPLNDGSIEEEAVAAIHSDQQAQTVAAEARHLAGQAGKPTRNMTAKVFRQRARMMLSRMSVKDATRPNAFLEAERRSAKRAEEAFARTTKGRNAGESLAAAAKHKEQQMLNHYLYMESRDLTKMVASKREKMRNYSKASVREKIGGEITNPDGTTSPGYIQQIDALLEGYDFRVRSAGQIKRSEKLRAFVERMVEEGRERDLDIDERLLDEANRKHYTKMSVDELQGLFDTIENIDHMGRFKQKLIDAKNKRDLQEVADTFSTAISDRFGTGKAANQSKQVRNFFNLLFSVDTMMVDLDGTETGDVYDLFKAPLDRGQAQEQQMNVAMADAVQDIFSVYSSKELSQMQVQKLIPGGNGHTWSKMEIISLALNTGHQDGRNRILEETVHPERRLTQDQLDALLDTLEKGDWDFVQSMLKQVNSYWPELAATHKRRKGTELKKVEAVPIETKFGVYPGGYYPLAYDSQRSIGAAKDEASAWDKFNAAGRGSRIEVKSGMTIARKENSGGRTIDFDLNVALRHMRDTIRVITMSEVVDNAARIIKHKDVETAFMDAGQTNQFNTLKLFLDDLAVGPVYNTDPINSFARVVKNNFTMAKLAFNFKTVALQVTGITQSSVVVGKRNMVRGYRDYLANPNAAVQMAMEKSAFMSERKTSFQKDIYDQINDIQLSSPLAKRTTKVKNAVGKAGFYPMIRVQFLTVDVPTWIAAHDAKLREGATDEAAVKYADRIVARSQGSGLYADRNALERGTVAQNMRQSDFIRLWTTLGSYMVTKMNRGYLAAQKGKRGISEAESVGEMAGSALNMASDLALLYMAEAVMMGLAYALLAGDDADEEDLTKFIMTNTATSVIGGVPIVSGVANAFQGYGAGGVLASVLEMPANVATQLRQGENDAALWRSISDAGGMLTGLPSTATYRAIEGIVRGVDEGELPLADMFFGSNPLTR